MKTGARTKTTTSDPVKNATNDQVNHQLQLKKQDGNDRHEDENEDYEDDDDDYGGENNGEEERPKLAEGFYEIEALRKTRIRKGVKQYLIKWRGYPESANTWEPVESFMSCPDVLEAFESMNSGKRKRRRKHSMGSTSQSKKKQKQQQDSPDADAAYPIPSSRVKLEESLVRPSVQNSKETENNVGGNSYSGTANQSNKLERKLNEIKATSSMNQENMTEFAIHIQEDLVESANADSKVDATEVRRASPRIGAANGISKVAGTEVRRASPRIGAANGISKVAGTEVRRFSPRIGAANGISKVDRTEVQPASPVIGARRRKSCAVKRFKKESNSAPKEDATEETTIGNDVIVQDITKVDDMVIGLESDNILENPQSVPVITKIVKPVNYSISTINDTEEVFVSFLVRRSDAEEIIVDNKYLKENNPILLINFYEQHLRYNSPSE